MQYELIPLQTVQIVLKPRSDRIDFWAVSLCVLCVSGNRRRGRRRRLAASGQRFSNDEEGRGQEENFPRNQQSRLAGRQTVAEIAAQRQGRL